MEGDSRLTPSTLRAFKLNDTDENAKIGAQLREFLPDVASGLVLDVGAGLGDIAEAVFPARDVVLIDILDHEAVPNPRHIRVWTDFFDYHLPANTECGVMIMSHVLQYIDDDVARLGAKVEELAPQSLITVVDDYDPLQEEVLDWFNKHAIMANPERPICGFPPPNYRTKCSVSFSGVVEATGFAHLADALGRIIFDAPLGKLQVGELARWLYKRLKTPRIEIPQTATLYERV